MARRAPGGDTPSMRRFDELSDSEKTEKLLRLAQKALAAFGLSGELGFVAQGANTVFRLRAGGVSHAVRICAPGYDHATLRRELLWLAALARDTALAVPEPVLTLTGDLFRSISMEGVPGTRACMILRWIDGERREAELSSDEAAAMGRFVATLHRHAEGFRWPEELALEYQEPASRVLAAADTLRGVLTSSDDRALLCDAASAIAEATEGLGDGPEAVGIVHGDLRLRKMRHDQGSVGAFGFDECRIGTYLDDLSVLWNEFCGRDTGPSLQADLLGGYRAERELPHSMEDVVRAFVTLRFLESLARLATEARTNRTLSRETSTRIAKALRQRLADARSAGDDGDDGDAVRA